MDMWSPNTGVFAYAKCWLSHDAAHFKIYNKESGLY